MVAVAGQLAVRTGFAQPPELSFMPHRDFAVGENPSSVATGDFNFDGHADIAVANSRSESISLLLGDGAGSFSAAEPQLFEAGVPSAIEVSDVDLDSRLDLVVTSDVDGTVTVLLGNGDATFQERSRTRVGNGPEGLMLADFDNDGVPDVATADAFGDTVTILLGQGNGDLRPSSTLLVGEGPCGIAGGDLDLDGFRDLVVSLGVENVVVVLLGNGDGSFRNRCTGDCGGDGRVTVDELVRGVNLALGNPAVTACPAFDTNADGLITVNELVRGVNSALDGCTGGALEAGAAPAALLVDDFTGDGVPDVVAANEGSDFISVLMGFGDGTFDTPQDFPVGALARGLVAADFDGDEKLDLATAHRLTNSVSVLLGRGDGTFGPPQSFGVNEAPTGGLTCEGIGAADFNGDGLADVVTANEGSDDVSVLINQTE